MAAAPVFTLPVAAPPTEVPAFGIENAVGLLKALPLDENPELVLRIVRKTLRSSGVSVEDVVGSARSREMKLNASIREENEAIDHLERQIAARRLDIERLTSTLDETRDARLRLEEALETESKVGLTVPPPEVVARLQAEAASKAIAPKPLSKPPPSTAKPRFLPKPPIPLPSRAPPNAGPVPPPAPSPKPPLAAPPAPSSRPPLTPTSPKPPAVAPSPASAVAPPPSSGTPITTPSPMGVTAPPAKESRHELPSVSGWDAPPSEPTVRVAVPVRDDSTDDRDE